MNSQLKIEFLRRLIKMFWSYTEDIKVLSSKKSPEELSKEMNKSPARIYYRRIQLKGVTVEQLEKEEQFILDNFAKLSVLDMAKELGTNEVTVSRRIQKMRAEGKVGEKPKITSKTKEWEIESMPKVMKAKPPKGALNKKNIQRDILEAGKEYLIIKKTKKNKIKKYKLKVIGIYKDYYMLEDERGKKHSLLKVDYYIGKWSYEEVR